MIVVGIVGGVASGKSTISGMFQKLGAVVLDADRVGHEVLADPKVIEQLTNRWGKDILDADGQIRRSSVASIVFAENEQARTELSFLESITHPEIGIRIAQQLKRLADSGQSVAILDAPLLIKAGWDALCDSVLFIDADDSVRLERALERGWDEEEFRKREAFQTPLGVKRERADRIINTSGTISETESQVHSIWRELAI